MKNGKDSPSDYKRKAKIPKIKHGVPLPPFGIMTFSRKQVPSITVEKIQKLSRITQNLYAGQKFEITRLTTLKSLCDTPEVAANFVLYLAKLTQKKMEEKAPKHIQPEKWKQHKKLVVAAISQMERYLETQRQEGESALRQLWRELKELQNTYENQRWGPVRLVESTQTLLVEKALGCILSPDYSPRWAYQVAREYAERYNPSYGTGLLPESAPMMADIVAFWVQFYGLNVGVSGMEMSRQITDNPSA